MQPAVGARSAPGRLAKTADIFSRQPIPSFAVDHKAEAGRGRAAQSAWILTRRSAGSEAPPCVAEAIRYVCLVAEDSRAYSSPFAKHDALAR